MVGFVRDVVFLYLWWSSAAGVDGCLANDVTNIFPVELVFRDLSVVCCSLFSCTCPCVPEWGVWAGLGSKTPMYPDGRFNREVVAIVIQFRFGGGF